MQKEISVEQAITTAFGSYRAEWLKDKIYAFFTQPNYFPELLDPSTCVLMGGRGTGKTTALRCLSYEGQYALSGNSSKTLPFFGLYYRVNTNRVTAFYGQGKEDTYWGAIFSHYFNLILAGLIADFLIWDTDKNGILDDTDLKILLENIDKSLCIEKSSNLDEFRISIQQAKIDLENFINNQDGQRQPQLSLQASPIDLLFNNIDRIARYKGKMFYILIDEYENFLDYQQKIVNTIIKHSGEHYFFKIGVRELGWRERTTLNINESLISPADYNFIDISERLTLKVFSEFARKVCNDRLAIIRQDYPNFFANITKGLESFTDEQEAEALGVKKFVDANKKSIKGCLPKELLCKYESKPLLEQYALSYFSKTQEQLSSSMLIEYLTDEERWTTKYNNYKHALLFTIASKNPRRKKYYAGWNTFLHLASGNIRYLLELVVRSLLLSVQKNNDYSCIDCDTQTDAATAIARKNLNELEGLTAHGAQLTKLLLSLGRIFGLLATEVDGKAPEVTEFEVAYDLTNDADAIRISEIFKSAVMNLALLRLEGSKLNARFEIRDCDYMLHTIFAPLFVYSYRKKRKTKISATNLLELIDSPKNGIQKFLSGKNISLLNDMPHQLSLFEGHFNER